MEFHEAASIFPMMEGADFEALKEDIRKNGLLEPIWTYDGKIIDGRNRYLACEQVEVQTRFREWHGEGSLISFVVSLNLHRRHLDTSQRALIAAKIKPQFEEEAKQRQIQGGKVKANLPEPMKGQSREQAATLLNVSPRSVESASKVLKDGIPELVAEVESGQMPVSVAARIAAMPETEQLATLKMPHVAHNSGDNEWYTPEDIAESARSVMGEINLDPASTEEANVVIGAEKIFTEQDDGLAQEWEGRVFLNPPYASNLIGQFSSKLVAHVRAEDISAAIVLVNNATETKWFQGMLQYASSVCFPLGRVKFWHPRKIATPLQGQAIIYFGSEWAQFENEFSQYGTVCHVL